MLLNTIVLLTFTGNPTLDPNLLYNSNESVLYNKIKHINNTSVSQNNETGPVNDKNGSLLKACKAQLAKAFQQVGNAFSATIFMTNSKKDYKNYEKNIRSAKLDQEKFIVATAKDYHTRMVHARIYKKINNSRGEKDAEAVLAEWKMQEAKTYIGTLINKKLDVFFSKKKDLTTLISDKYSENCRSDGVHGQNISAIARKTWSNEIFERLMGISGDQRKADIQVLANPTIYDTVFEYFYSLESGTYDNVDVKKPDSVWAFSHRVYARIFPHLPSPKSIADECDKYLQEFEQSCQPKNERPSLETKETLLGPPMAEKSLKRSTSTAFQRFVETMY